MDFISELITVYGMFIEFLFTFQVIGSVTMGHLVVSLLLIMTIFTFLLGRLKRSR